MVEQHRRHDIYPLVPFGGVLGQVFSLTPAFGTYQRRGGCLDGRRADRGRLLCLGIRGVAGAFPGAKIVNPQLVDLPVALAEAEPRILIFEGLTEVFPPIEAKIPVVAKVLRTGLF